MNILYIYIFFFSLLLVGACISFFILNKRYGLRRKESKPKLTLFSLLSTIIISLFAIIYCISNILSDKNFVNTLSRPDIGEGDKTISLNVDSEIYTGAIDIEIQEKELSFEEAMEIFSKYRPTLDEYVLNDNSSFLNVTKPLSFPSSIGDEEIAISWYISNPNIIDYTGNILTDNMTANTEDLEIIATLKLDNQTAEICYFITVHKLPLTSKEELSLYINKYINNQDLLNMSEVNLPSHMNNMDLHFYNDSSFFPPIFIHSCYYSSSYTICNT